MALNPPIQSISERKAPPDQHIHRYLNSISPYTHQHAQVGQKTFQRDVVDEERAVERLQLSSSQGKATDRMLPGKDLRERLAKREGLFANVDSGANHQQKLNSPQPGKADRIMEGSRVHREAYLAVEEPVNPQKRSRDSSMSAARLDRTGRNHPQLGQTRNRINHTSLPAPEEADSEKENRVRVPRASKVDMGDTENTQRECSIAILWRSDHLIDVTKEDYSESFAAARKPPF